MLQCEAAFAGCKSLHTITIPSTVTGIEKSAFQGINLTRFEFPEAVTEVSESLFSFCENLIEVIFKDTLQSIKFAAFESCLSLKTLPLPDSVTEIEPYAFSCCDSLSQFTFPRSLTVINPLVFHNCMNLKSVFITNNTKHIKYSAFFNTNDINIIFEEGCNFTIDPQTFQAKCNITLMGNIILLIRIINVSILFSIQSFILSIGQFSHHTYVRIVELRNSL